MIVVSFKAKKIFRFFMNSMVELKQKIPVKPAHCLYYENFIFGKLLLPASISVPCEKY